MSSKEDIQSHWHPDFKIKSTLPDMRVVHTHFVLNLFVFTAFFILALFTLKREYEAYLLRHTISSLEQQIQSKEKDNSLRLEESKRFQELAQNIKELQLFFNSPFRAHDSIVELASIKPEAITFTRLVLSESVSQTRIKRKIKQNVNFNLVVAGNVQDLSILTQLKRELEESALLNPSGYSVSIDEEIKQRDTDTGIIPFQISVLLKPGIKKDTP